MKKILLIAALCAFCVGMQAQEKKYEIKSGIVTMEMDMMGRTVVQEIYFDDYGAKQATISEMRGQKMRGVEVNGEMLMINDAEKTAMKMPGMPGGGSGERIDYLNTDPKYIKKNKIKVLGTEMFLDRECTKYSAAIFMMGQVVKETVWIYKGIILKSSMATDFGEMVRQATNLVEDVEIPASTFEVPEDLEIQTMSRGPMGGGRGFGGGEF